jgi:hypothetical protein
MKLSAEGGQAKPVAANATGFKPSRESVGKAGLKVGQNITTNPPTFIGSISSVNRNVRPSTPNPNLSLQLFTTVSDLSVNIPKNLYKLRTEKTKFCRSYLTILSTYTTLAIFSPIENIMKN